MGRSPESLEQRRIRSRARSREWRAANRERDRERHAQHHAANRASELDRNRRWREANADRKRTLNREWAATNREVKRAIRARYVARKAGATGDATTEQILARVAYFGGRCWMCGEPWECIDHVKPLARGGPNWPANMRPSCRACNSSKRDRWDGPTDTQVRSL